MRSGFVSIVGRPNVGKSTLLNSLIGEHIAITSNKPQTTRNLIQGIYNDEESQIIFVDTPGIHKPVHKLGNLLNSHSYYSINEVDVILLVIDASTQLGKGDLFVIEKLKEIEKPVILILNKIDLISNDEILKKIDEYKDLYDFSEIVPVSSLKNDNVDRIIKVIKKYLTDDVRYFNETDVTSASLEFRICELVREKILDLTKDEIPHSVTCILTDYKTLNNIAHIYVDIIVDRESVKKIILGKNGIKIKEIGMLARNDIEKLLGKQIYLELYVRVIKKWRDKEKLLRELGFTNQFE